MKFLKTILSILLISPCAWATELVHTSKTDLKMGRGYNSSTQIPSQFCLKPTYEVDGSSSSTIKVLTAVSQRELEKELGFGMKGRYKMGVTNMSAQADFLKTSKSNGFSVSYTFKSNYEFPPRGLTKYEWTESAKTQLKLIPKSGGLKPSKNDDASSWSGKVVPLNLDQWYKKCGDEVITSQTLGARFYFNIKVVFSNKRDFQKFTTGFDLSSPTVGISADFKQQMKKMAARTDVTVSALQVGGQVDKITGIFGNSAKPFVKCSGGDLENCMGVIETAISYATDITPISEGGTGFPAQIDPNIEPGIYGGPAVLSSVTQKYEHITNFQEPTAALKKLAKKLEEDLNVLFDDIFNDWTYSAQVRQTGLPRLNFDQTQRLAQIETEAYDDIMEVVDAIDRCYNDISSCPSVYEEIDPSEHQEMGQIYDVVNSNYVDYTDALNFEPKSFAALCDQHQGKLLSRKLNHTVKQLISSVNVCESNEGETKCSLQGASDLCGAAQDALEELETMDLSGRGISDLTPFSWFPNLVTLNLSGNKIGTRDLEPLKSLEKLEVLNLGRNFLKTMGVLPEMQNLIELKVNGNQLRDISELSSLENIELLDASSNRGRLECPFSEEERCILVDYSKQTSFYTAPSSNGERRYQGEMIDLNEQYLLLIGGREMSYMELIDKNNMNHIKLNKRVGNRMGATYAKVSEHEVLISGGFGVNNSVVKLYIADKTNEVTSEIVKTFNSEQMSQESINLDDGRILISGGYKKLVGGAVLVVNDAYVYHPTTGIFELLPQGMKEPRAGHKMVKAPNGKVYLIGGKTYNPVSGEKPSNTIEVFHPETNEFQTLGERMNSRRSGHTATLIDEDTILIAGGFDVNVPGSLFHQVTFEDQQNIHSTRTAELFFIKSESIYALPRKMDRPRANHEAIRLEDGKILLIGGQRNPANFSYQTVSCGVCERTAEIFDTQKEVFISTGTLMSYERVNFVLAQLPDRRVYISGGVGEGASWYSEIFSYSNLD